MTEKKKSTPYWKEFPKQWHNANGNPITVPEIMHFDEDGNFDAHVQPSMYNMDLWEVWIGRPGRLIDDKVASKEEAIALAEQILGGE